MKKGFTLIELLVVVAIIGLLASVVVVSLGGARSGARDARRAGDIAQLRTALELYASNSDGNYPAVLSGLAPTYIPAVPTDPTGTAYSYCKGTTRSYGIGTVLENAGSDIMSGSVALANMPAGCTLSTNFTPNLACQANGASNTNYCVRN